VSWYRKCKIKWARVGDCSSGFFHRMANGRRKKNHIGHLVLDNGVCTRDRMEIEEEILNSLSNFYSPAPPPPPALLLVRLLYYTHCISLLYFELYS